MICGGGGRGARRTSGCGCNGLALLLFLSYFSLLLADETGINEMFACAIGWTYLGLCQYVQFVLQLYVQPTLSMLNKSKQY